MSHGVWPGDPSPPRRRGLVAEAASLVDPPERSRVAGQCVAALASSGVTAALALLNQRTRFRFTGAYKIEAPMLRNVALFDRENPTLLFDGGVTPQDGMKTVAGDLVNGGAGVSCVAAPIRLPSGVLWGTLCHFDLRPRLLPNDEVAVLRATASVFGRWLNESRLRAEGRRMGPHAPSSPPAVVRSRDAARAGTDALHSGKGH